jgi:hypothetical protein
MRVLVDLGSHVAGAPSITQVERVPENGVLTPINGKYVLPIIPGAEFPITTSSYILDGGGDVDGGDVSSVSFAHLLASYPQFGRIYFNPLLTEAHVGEIDITATFLDQSVSPPVTLRPRFKSGRPAGLGAAAGQMPTHTALFSVNVTTTPSRPGLLITKEIDIATVTSGVGADLFLPYWKILDFSVTEDVSSQYGATNGMNVPALRYVLETDQEPSGFSVYLSPDNGDHWCEVGLLEPVAFCEKTTRIRIAFLNYGTERVHLANYAVLF